MKEFIEKLIGRLEEKVHSYYKQYMDDIIGYSTYNEHKREITGIIEIVNKLTEEYINTSTDTSTNSLDASTNTSTTNADRIRSMTDEELAEFLGGVDHTVDDCEFVVKIGDEWLHDSTADILEWLQSEVEGVTENERRYI